MLHQLTLLLVKGAVAGVIAVGVLAACVATLMTVMRQEPDLDGPQAFGGIVLSTLAFGVPLCIAAVYLYARLIGLVRPGRLAVVGPLASLAALCGLVGSPVEKPLPLWADMLAVVTTYAVIAATELPAARKREE